VRLVGEKRKLQNFTLPRREGFHNLADLGFGLGPNEFRFDRRFDIWNEGGIERIEAGAAVMTYRINEQVPGYRKYPGGSGSLAWIEQRCLAPKYQHSFLSQVVRNGLGNATPEKIRLQARGKLPEQVFESGAVPVRRNRDDGGVCSRGIQDSRQNRAGAASLLQATLEGAKEAHITTGAGWGADTGFSPVHEGPDRRGRAISSRVCACQLRWKKGEAECVYRSGTVQGL